MNANAAVEVSGLTVTYGEVLAVDDVTFSIPAEAVFGLVGPNGAGKTSVVECVEGLRRAQRGQIALLGAGPRPARGYSPQRAGVFRQVGVQLQESSLYHRIRVSEALRLFASFFANPVPPEQLIQDFALGERAGVYYVNLSAGEKRALLTALALVGRPELVILDEPTSGLDPHARRRFWTVLRKYRGGTRGSGSGLTVFLTTHNLLEAEEECDRVCMIDRGRIVAMGAPRELLAQSRLGTRVSAAIESADLPLQVLASHPGVTRAEVSGGRVSLFGTGKGFVSEISQLLQSRAVSQLTVRPANLEDLYLVLTGRDYDEESVEIAT